MFIESMGKQFARGKKQLCPVIQIFIEHLRCVSPLAGHRDPAKMREPRYGAKSGDESDPRVMA